MLTDNTKLLSEVNISSKTSLHCSFILFNVYYFVFFFSFTSFVIFSHFHLSTEKMRQNFTKKMLWPHHLANLLLHHHQRWFFGWWCMSVCVYVLCLSSSFQSKYTKCVHFHEVCGSLARWKGISEPCVHGKLHRLPSPGRFCFSWFCVFVSFIFFYLRTQINQLLLVTNVDSHKMKHLLNEYENMWNSTIIYDDGSARQFYHRLYFFSLSQKSKWQ